jgi:hypothetical protein
MSVLLKSATCDQTRLRHLSLSLEENRFVSLESATSDQVQSILQKSPRIANAASVSTTDEAVDQGDPYGIGLASQRNPACRHDAGVQRHAGCEPEQIGTDLNDVAEKTAIDAGYDTDQCAAA